MPMRFLESERDLKAAFAGSHDPVLVGFLVGLHGGTIEVESEPGKGSTFTLRFPIQEKS